MTEHWFGVTQNELEKTVAEHATFPKEVRLKYAELNAMQTIKLSSHLIRN